MVKKNLALFALSIALFSLLACISPQNPYLFPQNAMVSLILQNSNGYRNTDAIADTVENKILVGMIGFLSSYIDSVKVTIGTSAETDTILTYPKATSWIDTQWIKIAFHSMGTRTITVNASIQGQVKTVNATIVIVGRPVAISAQPQSQTVTAGQSVTFSVTATGTAPFSYQWYDNGTAISGATSSSYSISNVQAANMGTYTVTVSNGTSQNATSSGALLIVNPAPIAPSITAQPQSQTVTAGQSVTFSVTATGAAPLSYQWYINGAAMGATSSSYTISNVKAVNAGTYTVMVSNGILPNATSKWAVLTVNVPPSITAQPQSQTVTAGGSVTFTVAATGTAPLSYQWYDNGSAIPGATSSSYSIPNTQAANAGTYTVTVSNGTLPNATSNWAVLAVNVVSVAPRITAQQLSQTVTAGQSITFIVAATGTAPLSYQWLLNGTAIPGATSSSYTISNFQAANAGTYTVTVSNGTLPNATSSGAVLTVNPASGTVTDIDGNIYQYITIGTQTWMVENLKTTRYNDGAAIPLITDNTAWGALRTPGYCWYNDSTTYRSTYGALYNWYAVNTGKLAPTGWHVPTDAEWTALTTYLGGETVAAGPLKSTGTTYWLSPNTGATNSSGFSALPGGCRNDVTFTNIGYYGYWWSSTAMDATNSWSRYMNYSYAYVYRNTSYCYNVYGFSVRCVRNP